MKHLDKIEKEWGVKLPEAFARLYEVEDWSAVRADDGTTVRLPATLLDPEQIARLAEIAEDWEIPSGLLPIMGDMHDLVCLDYRTSARPSVVLLDDARAETPLCDSLEAFLSARVDLPETKRDLSDIIVEEGTWFDF